MTNHMELDELKNIWNADDKGLDSRIKVNEQRLMKMNMENATGEINKIVRTSLLGRNMALVYCLISIGMAVSVIEVIEYSVPAVLGALAMLWSFISHLSIEKPNYKDSILHIQKTICAFRIHLAANAKYDILIVTFWLLTAAPIFLKLAYDVSLYHNPRVLAIFCLIASVAVSLMIALSRKVYEEYDRTLKKSEAHLQELINFEKDS